MDYPNRYYVMACEFMAKTELFDRNLTNCRSPWDDTEAFIHQPYLRKWSNEYALQLKNYFTERCGVRWRMIKNEIIKHNFYTAQMWVDEYYRLKARQLQR